MKLKSLCENMRKSINQIILLKDMNIVPNRSCYDSNPIKFYKTGAPYSTRCMIRNRKSRRFQEIVANNMGLRFGLNLKTTPRCTYDVTGEFVYISPTVDSVLYMLHRGVVFQLESSSVMGPEEVPMYMLMFHVKNLQINNPIAT